MKQKIRGSEMVRTSWPLRFLAVPALVAMTACSAHVQSTGTYVPPAQYSSHPMPRPHEVLVYGFTIDPNTIQLDSGLKARLAAMSGSSDPQAERRQLAFEITSAISETLVDAINRMGLVAVPAGPDAQARPGDVLIQGQIVRVTAGNAARRAIVGFGVGKSEIYANVQVLRAAPGGYAQPLQTYDANANSGRTPGLALGAAGLAAGHVALAVAGAAAGTVARQRTGLPKDAEDLAKKVATNVGDFFAAQGWIAPS
jgi:Domain of unknown function (DUF4410)